MKSNEILWNSMKSHEIQWNFMKFNEIGWNPVKSNEIQWNHELLSLIEKREKVVNGFFLNLEMSTFWQLLKFHGIQFLPADLPVDLWTFLPFFVTVKTFLKTCIEILWNSMKFNEIPWNSMKSDEIRWNSMNSMKSSEIQWNPMKFH